MKQNLPAGLIDNNLEVFADGDNLKALYNGSTIDFFELPQNIIDIFYDDMIGNSTALTAMKKHGLKNLIEMLKQFVWCNFGGFDHSPDLTSESNELIHEYWDCGKRDNCPFNCKVCGRLKTENGEYLTKQEITIIKLIAKGLYDAELADALGIAQGTLIAHKANIYRKLDAHSKADCVVFAAKNNML
jgi:DNA-binding CsgD family transcriptional regulator